ncbi:MAG: nitroreductase family protein [Proteobacteria bacterium]|nr:nitroreductase family protein [Pseudomonadota bacterium]
MNFNDVLNSRRSVNFFDPDKRVSNELLKSVLDMAAKTPSSFNLQPWSVIVVDQESEKETLKKLAWNQPKVTEAPLTLIVLADRHGWKEGHPFVEKNFQEMIRAGSMQESQREWFKGAREGLYGATPERQLAFAAKNAGFFAMTLMLAAKSKGLDTHPMDGFDLEGVKKAFHIPDNYWVPLLIAVGYFKQGETLMPAKWRKTADELIVRFD